MTNSITERANDALKSAGEALQDSATRAREAARDAYKDTLSAYEDQKDRAVIAIAKGKENLAIGKERAIENFETAKIKSRDLTQQSYDKAKDAEREANRIAGPYVEKSPGLAVFGAFAFGVAAALVIPKR